MNFEKMFHTIDTHVLGEAFRIVIQSPISFHGTDIRLNNEQLKRNFQNEKNLLLNEPRGHRGMHGCVVTPSREADFALLFFNHENVSGFKYEGLVAAVTALIETGNLKETADGLYRVETENGVHTVRASTEHQEVNSVCVESGICTEIYSSPENVLVNVDQSRNYILFELPDSIPGIDLDYLAALSRWGMEKTAQLKNEKIDFEAVILVDSSRSSPTKVCTVTFEKDGYILRSPGIDSTFSLFTSLLKKNPGQTELENESVFGSSLTVKVQAEGERQFSAEAAAFVTGTHEFVVDQDDPLKNGFLLV